MRSKFAGTSLLISILLMSVNAGVARERRGGDVCICKSMTIRGLNLPAERRAYGPSGKPANPANPGEGWNVGGKPKGDDGKTLGPLGGNPDNPVDAQGVKRFIGYSFEVVTTVQGKASKCKEIQLAKATGEYFGFTKKKDCEDGGGTWNATTKVCNFVHSWKGNEANLDKAGKQKLTINTKKSCEDLGGKWSGGECRLEFPLSGANYGPDIPPNDPTHTAGAYERPWKLKRHNSGEIIWKDAVTVNAPGVNSTLNASILPVVRGTDGKYCFAQIEIRLKRTATGADETATLGQHGDKKDASDIP